MNRPTDRILELATQANNDNTIPITYSGPAPGERYIHEKTYSNDQPCTPVLSTPGQAQTPDDAERLQIAYACFHDNYVALDAGCTRHEFLASGQTSDETGRIPCQVSGVVTGYSFGLRGRVSRICLMFPQSINSEGGLNPVGNHLWLLTSQMKPDVSLIGDRYSGDGNNPLCVNLGDTIIIHGYLCAYRDKHGRHRFGIEDWTPMLSKLLYGQKYVDGSHRLRVVSPRLIKTMRLLTIKPNGYFTPAEEERLRSEVQAARDANPDIASMRYTPSEAIRIQPEKAA